MTGLPTLIGLAARILAATRSTGSASPEARSPARLVAVAGLGLLAAASTSAALGCAAAAGWIWLRPLVGPAGSPLIVAAGFAILGLVPVLLIRRLLRPAPPSRPPPPTEDALIGEATRLVVAHKIPTLIAAVVVGAILGSNRK